MDYPFIVFEGIDGAGKTTISNKVSERLKGYNIISLTSKCPGHGEFGSQIRNLLLSPDNKTVLSTDNRICLFLADFINIYENFIKPNYENRLILLDRYYFSMLAYQDMIIKDADDSWSLKYSYQYKYRQILNYLTDIPIDLLCHITIPVKTAIKRITANRELDGSEALYVKEFDKITENYRLLMKPNNYIKEVMYIDGTLDIEYIVDMIVSKIMYICNIA